MPNFIKRRHPRKGEKKKQGARTKVQASKQPNEAPGGKGDQEHLYWWSLCIIKLNV
jgi:hypothetical protein